MDMENQVKANSMRIMVLEEQNGALRNSIAKVLQTQKRGPREVSIYAQNGVTVVYKNIGDGNQIIPVI